MTESLTSMQAGELLERNRLLQLLKAGVWTGERRFVRQLALTWLTAFPGDLEVLRWMAAGLAADGKVQQAILVLDKLMNTDPEDAESLAAYETLCTDDPEKSKMLQIKLHALGLDAYSQAPEWAERLRQNHLESIKADSGTLKDLVKLLPLAPDEPLVAIEHVKIVRRIQDARALITLTDLYQKKWPDCLIFRLASAEALAENGQESAAVNLLHHCAADDAAGQVAHRWWRDGNPYQALWSADMSVLSTVPVPAAVKHWMGENWLPEGQTAIIGELEDPCDSPVEEDILAPSASQESLTDLDVVKPEDLVEANGTCVDDARGATENVQNTVKGSSSGLEKAFERIAKQMKQGSVASSDGRYPIYVLFSTRDGLTKKYGAGTFTVIEQEMQRLAKAVRARSDWGAAIFIADDAKCVEKFGLTPVPPTDPWKLKLALTDLDQALGKKGERIGAVVILGSPDVVPFHRLPNPVDDMDQEVLSDSPYATIDKNYFVPIWPVGRITGEAGADAGLLLQQIRAMVKYHQDAARKIQEEKQSDGYLLGFWRNIFRRAAVEKKGIGSVGFTASVWKRASVAVFRPVGVGNNIMISPPVTSELVDTRRLSAGPLSYFNLHGLEDAPDWYGQRDVNDPAGIDYPVAMRPKDLVKNGKAPQIVFSEACYGGHIVGKKENTSIALRFLAIGTLAVVGSTCVSYGSVGLPLIGADLLANLFWRYIKEGYTVGDALLHAKIGLAREMTKRQGFLDGEDQKTLIQFVLYGDPLMSYDMVQQDAKRVLRSKSIFTVKTICERGELQEEAQKTQVMPAHDQEIIRQVKAAVAPYLPGIDHVDVQINLSHSTCDGKDHCCPTSDLKMKSVSGPVNRSVVVLSKQMTVADHVHTQYVRVTVNENGKPVKMVFSR